VHLLAGLLAIHSGALIALLEELNISADVLSVEVGGLKHVGAMRTDHGLPLSESARSVLVNAEQEAADMRHEVIGPEHILLGLVRVPRTSVGRFFENLRTDLRKVRELVSDMAKRRQTMAARPSPPVTEGPRGEHEFTIIWDPTIVEPEDYARLVSALGELVRAEGGAGIQRLDSTAAGVPVESEVFV
jgi:ATP-dependent Clp protease ATP-binding subunit ClpA